ncbi:MAG: hypothetical protein IT176_09395 [Acidobacteria bacterium]|nr:hypothetical protein [Acidobacteriota bacterium]
MLKLLLLPFWLAAAFLFFVLVVPFLVLRLLFKLAVGLLVLPVVIVGGLVAVVIGAAVVSVLILIPLVPIALACFLIWAVLRVSRPLLHGV